MKRLIKWTSLSLIASVAVAGILLFTMDLGFLRGMIEERVRTATGRDFSIADGLSVRFGREIVVQAEDVRLGNAEWAASGDLVSIGKLNAVVDTRSLWQGPLRIRQIEMEALDAALVQNESGQGNWQFSTAMSDESSASAELPFLLDSLVLTNANIEYLAPNLERPLHAVVDRMEQGVAPDGLIYASLNGEISGRPMHMSGSGGPYARLVSGDDVALEGTGSFGQIAFSGNASFDNLWAPSKPVIDVQISGPDFEELTDILGIERLGGGDLALQVSSEATSEGLLVRATGNLGEFVIDATGESAGLQGISRASVTGSVSGPNFGRIAGLAGKKGWPEEPFTLVTRFQQPGNTLQIEDFDLRLGRNTVSVSGNLPNFPALNGSDLALRISGPDLAPFKNVLGVENLPAGAFTLSGDVTTAEDGQTSIDTNFQIPMASGRVSGSLGSDTSLVGTDVSVTGKGRSAAELGRILGVDGLAAQPWSLNLLVSVEDPEFYELGDLVFRTRGLEVEITGRVGTEAIDAGTDVRFSVRGERLADFQSLAGDQWTLPGEPFTLSGQAKATLGAWELTGVAGDTESVGFSLDGMLGTEKAFAGTRLQFSFRGDRLADFQGLAGEAITLPEQPFTLGGQVGAAEGGWNLAAVKGGFGATNFELNGQVGTMETLAGTDLSLALSGTDIGKILDLPGQARMPDGPFTGSVQIGLDRGRVRIAQADIKAGAFSLKMNADVPWPIDLSNGSFSVDSSGADITRILPELSGIAFDSEDFEVHATGSWRDGKISIQKGLARIGKSSLDAQGTLDLPPNVSATDFEFVVRSPDLSRLGTINGERWDAVPLTLRSSLTGTASSLGTERFRAQMGKSDITGAFSIDFEPETPLFDLQLSTDVLNLKPFMADAGEKDLAGDTETEKDARLIPELVFPMEALAGFDGHFSVTADRVILRRSVLLNSSLTGDVTDGSLLVSELVTGSYGGRLFSTLSLKPGAGGKSNLQLGIKSKGLVLDFTGRPEQERQALPAFDIDIRLEGAGKTVREAAAALNGDISVNSKGGQIKNVKEHGLDGLFLAKIVSAISPSAARQETINISCFAAAIDVRDGVVLLDPGMSIQSDKLNLFAGGNINLGSEKLDVNFRAETRKAVDLSASELVSPYLKLSGTMANPSIALDKKGTLLSGGAAYLSGGLSILAKKALDQLGGARDPCAEHLREVEGEEP